MAGKTLNWLVVGLGDVMVRSVLPALACEPRSRIVGAVTSRTGPSVEALVPRHWPTLKEALQEPAIDAVYVATPPFLHAAQTIEALRAGKHVLCEKPAALNVREARAMVDAADLYGLQLGIAYFRRCHSKLRRAKALVEAGAIGKPLSAVARCSEWRPPGVGPAWLHAARQAGAGPLYDIGSHRIDALNFILGDPNSVRAQRWKIHADASVEAVAEIVIEYKSGVIAEVEARWDVDASLDDFSIVGTAGALDLGPLCEPRLAHPCGSEFLPGATNRHAPLISEWVAALLDGAAFNFSGRNCFPAAWVLERAVADGPMLLKGG